MDYIGLCGFLFEGVLTVSGSRPRSIWTVAEAKARLSEILRLSEEEGPQRIGVRRAFVVAPERAWRKRAPGRRDPLGRWLVDNIPRGAALEAPDRREPGREVPFLKTDGE